MDLACFCLLNTFSFYFLMIEALAFLERGKPDNQETNRQSKQRIMNKLNPDEIESNPRHRSGRPALFPAVFFLEQNWK